MGSGLVRRQPLDIAHAATVERIRETDRDRFLMEQLMALKRPAALPKGDNI